MASFEARHYAIDSLKLTHYCQILAPTEAAAHHLFENHLKNQGVDNVRAGFIFYEQTWNGYRARDKKTGKLIRLLQ